MTTRANLTKGIGKIVVAVVGIVMAAAMVWITVGLAVGLAEDGRTWDVIFVLTVTVWCIAVVCWAAYESLIELINRRMGG